MIIIKEIKKLTFLNLNIRKNLNEDLFELIIMVYITFGQLQELL